MTRNEMDANPDLAFLYQCSERFAASSEASLIFDAFRELLSAKPTARRLEAYAILLAKLSAERRQHWRRVRHDPEEKPAAAETHHLLARYWAVVAWTVRCAARSQREIEAYVCPGCKAVYGQLCQFGCYVAAHCGGETAALGARRRKPRKRVGRPVRPPGKLGIAEIDGEPRLVQQAGETLTVPRSAGRHVWDGIDEKGRAGAAMREGRPKP